MRCPWLLPLTLLVGLLLGPAGACDDRLWYLDPANGSDANDCHTPQTACQSAGRLQEILAQARPGEVIRLKRGTTLTPTQRLDLQTDGTAAQPILLEAYGEGALPILDGSQIPSGNMILQCQRRAWYVIRDLQFQYGKGALMFLGCTDILIERIAIVHQCLQECLHMKYDGPDATSQRITWQHSVMDVPDRAEGVYIGTDPEQDGGQPDLTSHITIANNVIANGRQGECIEMKDGTSHVTIVGNQFANNVVPVNACIFSAKARLSTPPGQHRIEGNTLYNTSGDNGYAIKIRNSATVRGNVVHTTTRDGILLDQPSGHEDHERVAEHNTVLYAAGAGITVSGGKTTARNNIVWQSGGGNDAVDPQFVNPARADFRRRPGSPAVGRGAFPTPAPTPDGAPGRAGEARR